MRCMNPFERGYDHNGNVTSPRHASKEFVNFQFGCRKCLPCRLNQAREKAIRCWHESKCHEKSIFLTLTYSDQHLASPRLQYQDWQSFIQALRDKVAYDYSKTHLCEMKVARKATTISYMVTGEYGELNKRPHWHAILFNYAPDDSTYYRTSDRGDKLYKSKTIDEIWGKNDPDTRPNEFGAVTIESAGYVARYAAKKLVHGRDQEHNYHPLHKTSSKRAIGRSWLEKNWQHTFEHGFVNLPTGIASIPRYYTDWLKKHRPYDWERYVTEVRPDSQARAQEIQRREEAEYQALLEGRSSWTPSNYPEKRSKVKERILKQKFKQLQERLKL